MAFRNLRAAVAYALTPEQQSRGLPYLPDALAASDAEDARATERAAFLAREAACADAAGWGERRPRHAWGSSTDGPSQTVMDPALQMHLLVELQRAHAAELEADLARERAAFASRSRDGRPPPGLPQLAHRSISAAALAADTLGFSMSAAETQPQPPRALPDFGALARADARASSTGERQVSLAELERDAQNAFGHGGADGGSLARSDSSTVSWADLARQATPSFSRLRRPLRLSADAAVFALPPAPAPSPAPSAAAAGHAAAASAEDVELVLRGRMANALCAAAEASAPPPPPTRAESVHVDARGHVVLVARPADASCAFAGPFHVAFDTGSAAVGAPRLSVRERIALEADGDADAVNADGRRIAVRAVLGSAQTAYALCQGSAEMLSLTRPTRGADMWLVRVHAIDGRAPARRRYIATTELASALLARFL